LTKYRIAIASTIEGNVYPGHFAHSQIFKIYDYMEDGDLVFVEDRENPLGSLPDTDIEGRHHHHVINIQGIPLRGPPKYNWLRENILRDADVIIASDACQTSYRVFTSQGVRLIFTDPVSVDELVNYIEKEKEKFREIIEKYFEEET